MVICTANICRSPVAQLLLQQQLSGNEVEVISAGTHAVEGRSAESHMREIMVKRGFSQVEHHQSHILMPSMLDRVDLVLCMEEKHIKWIANVHPLALGKTKLMGHWNARQEVRDPINGPAEGFEATVNELELLSSQWAKKLLFLGVC